MGLETLLELPASAAPERIALGPNAGGIDFAGLLRRARGGAELLAQAGAQHVAYLGVTGPAFSCCVFAAAAAGMPITPLNYRLPDEELRELLRQLEHPLVLADADMISRLAGTGAPVLGTTEWFEQAAVAPPLERGAPAEDSIAVILFTSGTTSRPKAVILRHENLLAYTLQTVDLLGADEQECALVSVPPYHVAGVAAVLSNVYAGRRTVHLPAFTPAGWLELVRREGVTNATIVPTMLSRIVDQLGDLTADTPTLTTLAYGGARMSPSVLERGLRCFPSVGFVNAYGLTETSSTIALLGPDDHRCAVESGDPAVRARLGSAGRAVPGVELQVRDEGGRPLAAGEFGELWVRGPQVSGEYAGSGSTLDGDGWFPTRDRAMLDGEGYLFVEGRADDTIIRGGENIAPAEIEDVLIRHPAVHDAAVVGLPDEEWGQRVAAVVVPAPGASLSDVEMRSYARQQLRSSRTPDEIEIWSELPYNSMGKLLRGQIVATLAHGPARKLPQP